ncbi:hypothetical protein OPV22_003726 [Ensete ventricosum]|uniref:Uncharacterized protein n=1 Tax=Ensete ventricosum TaxID=4639 RepID=A0AAV8S1Q0_ENSVE|nr:hypothetical protein OPV22_003726 [Ensete ventricosum]
MFDLNRAQATVRSRLRPIAVPETPSHRFRHQVKDRSGAKCPAYPRNSTAFAPVSLRVVKRKKGKAQGEEFFGVAPGSFTLEPWLVQEISMNQWKGI